MKRKLFTVKSMTYLAMFIAITVVLGYVNKIIPEMPQGGTISIDIIAIFLCAYLMGWPYGLICGVCVSVIQFGLGIAVYYGPWSVLLDYMMPLSVVAVAPLFKNIKIGKVEIYTGIIIGMTLKFISHFCSGAFLFASYAPEGINPLVYSLAYNLPYNVATLIVCLIIVPVLYNSLSKTVHFDK